MKHKPMTTRMGRVLAAVTGAPKDWSADEVIGALRKFAHNTATHSEWDYFCSGITLSDPELEAIRLEASALHGPTMPDTDERLQNLIERAEWVKNKPVEKPE